MKKIFLINLLLYTNFSSVISHKSTSEFFSVKVTREKEPHTPEELLKIAENIIATEKKTQEKPNKPSIFYEGHQKALAEALRLMSREKRVELKGLLWFALLDRRIKTTVTKKSGKKDLLLYQQHL